LGIFFYIYKIHYKTGCIMKATNNFLLTASISLVMVLTISCSDNGSGEEQGNSPSNNGRDDIGNYNTEEIGNQTWITKNINYYTEGSLCYDNKPSNCDKYGRLYDWETAMRICPEGWHLPTNEDWEELFRYVRNYNGYTGLEREIEGRYLKAVEGWDDYDGDREDVSGIDAHGFAALPGGSYFEGFEDYFEVEGFVNAGSIGWWWSATKEGDSSAYFYDMFYNDKYIGHGWIPIAPPSLRALLSVRCVKN
jgi:uncharacterized protein (TIGR02145 family)